MNTMQLFQKCLVAECWTDTDASPTNVTRTIRLKQAMAVSNRFDLAKVTVRGQALFIR